MKVNLIKEAVYDLTAEEGKYTAIPSELFKNLIDYNSVMCENSEKLPKVMMFNTKDDYKKYCGDAVFDDAKDILINAKGQVFVHLKEKE